MTEQEQLYQALCNMPVMDAHTHIDASHLTARGLHDVLLYHMVISDLYSAGCPSGNRLAEYETPQEIERRMEEAIPFLPKIVNTSSYWGVRIILKELYGVDVPITMQNWRQIDAKIKQKGQNSGAWAREILKKAQIAKLSTEIVRRADASADDLFQYSLEWAFFTRCQWGIFDAPLMELEYVWSCDVISEPLPVTMAGCLEGVRKIQTLRDVANAMEHYLGHIPYDQLFSIASHWSTDLHYRDVTEQEMQAALDNRANAGPLEQEIYANYIQNIMLEKFQQSGRDLVLQFSIGSEPLPFEAGSKLYAGTLFELAQLMERFPKIKFQMYLSSESHNQAACTLVRELPNLSLAGYWWHNFFPSSIQKVIAQRLDMVALNKQIGFFSDAYCVDWSYAKSKIVRTQLAAVLAEKIQCRQYTMQEALHIAQAILYETPQELLGLVPNPALLA